MKTIEKEAFKSSKIKCLVVPDGMDIIDASIVSHCFSLESITIPSSITRLTGHWGGLYLNDDITMIMKGQPPVVDSMTDGIKVEVPDAFIDEYRNAKYWQRCNLILESQKVLTKRENGKTTFVLAKFCWLMLSCIIVVLSLILPFSKATLSGAEDVWLLLLLIAGVDSVVVYYITYKILYLVVYRRDNFEGNKFGKGKYNPIVYNTTRNIIYICCLIISIIALLYFAQFG